MLYAFMEKFMAVVYVSGHGLVRCIGPEAIHVLLHIPECLPEEGIDEEDRILSVLPRLLPCSC